MADFSPKPFQITWTFVPLDLNLPNQPIRAVRLRRMLRGVGEGAVRLLPIPVDIYYWKYATKLPTFSISTLNCVSS
jgi:hypothetical protein